MAALAQDYKQPEPFEIPEGGLASFLTATTGEWAEATNDDYIPETGIAGVKQVADKLAQYGRYEDEYMVHAAEGETVIPAQVLDLNPRLKAKLFKEMRDMGLEPERYVVGNELNSLNPVTGQPEFFLKKLFKGVKKAVKKVVKVLKKASTVVLPIVGTMIGGPIGAAIGGGIASLIQGGNLKDALKAAALSGLTAGVVQAGQAGFQAATQGSATGFGNIGEFFSGAGSSVAEGLSGGYAAQFGQGVSDLLGQGATSSLDINMAPTEGLTPVESQIAQGLPGNTLAPSGTIPGATDFVGQAAETAATLPPMPAATAPAATAPATTAPAATAPAATAAARTASPINMAPTEGLSPLDAQIAQGLSGNTLTPSATVPGTTDFVGQVASSAPTATAGGGFLEQAGGYFDRAGDYLFRGGRSLADIRLEASRAGMKAAEVARQEALQMGLTGEAQSKYILDAVNAAKQSVQPGMFQKYLPSTALALAGLQATGGFETPEVEPILPYDGVTGSDLLQKDRPMYAPGVYRYAATGGDISFPRMNGAIYGPGTETSDDIPAMLSDGEFVMTAKAVRGAGNGSRERGMERMYDIMSRFEGGALGE